MGSRHDVFVIDDRRAAVEFALVREHGHPRILVHVRGGAADDSVLLAQRSASLNNNYNYYYIVKYAYIITNAAISIKFRVVYAQCFSAMTLWSTVKLHSGPSRTLVNMTSQ